MRDISTGDLITQGSPDIRARLLCDALNPIDHYTRYRDLVTRFVVGEKDIHVPAEAAYRFAGLVNDDAGRGNVTVLEKAGLSHLDFVKRDWWEDLDFGKAELA